ncbi:MAG: clan AA aspartic protease [Cytophagales bacterium]|nr:clan AA aspartic protease [Cytophagales bacterium]
MGLIYTEIELINNGDLEMVRRHIIGEDEVNRMVVTALVDTGAIYLCINQTIKEALKLEIVEQRRIQTATGHIETLDVTAPVEIRFKNRRCVTSALVLPGNNEVLLGAIPLEDMDVIIHPQRQELIVHPDHPDMPLMVIK